MNVEAQKIVAALDLKPLPREGGFFRQTWWSEAGSAIYFLLTPEDFSALHLMPRANEVWHFHAGDRVEHVTLVAGPEAARVTILGGDVLAGDVPQLVVPAGMWQGARLAAGGRRGPSTSLRAGWALVGCTVAPAWDDRDFELGEQAALLREFPGATERICALTR